MSGSPRASISHIFADLDNKSRYLGSRDGQDYFLRVLTTEESVRKFPQALDLYTHLITEIGGDLNKQLSTRGQHLQKYRIT